MNEKLKEVFGQVQAESELKNKTKEFIFQKTKGYTHPRTFNYRHLLPVFACMAFFLFGGYRLYFTSTVAISIDINPSLELGVNRFDRIISFESYNNDGQELVESLDIKYKSYSEAVSQILESEEIASLLSEDEILTIAVIGTDSTQSEEILSDIQSFTAGKDNTYCCFAPSEEVKKAYEAGLSYGKYRAFLELQALDPSITVSEIQEMTMREIRDRIRELSEEDSVTSPPGNGSGCQESSSGQGRMNRRGQPCQP